MGILRKNPEKVAKDALEAFSSKITARANSVVRQVAIEADKAGMPMEYLQYVYYTLNEQQRRWPNLAKRHKAALQFALRLVNEVGAMPRYHAGIQVPPTEFEATVDTAITALAAWCNSSLFFDILKDYKGILKQFSKPYVKAKPECAKVAEACLQAHMEQIARTAPRSVANGELIFSFLSRI